MSDPSSPSHRERVTHLLRAWRGGDEAALGALMPLIQDELHRLAQRYMNLERPDHTLQATALVNEAFLRLAESDVPWQDRAHFFAVAARIMRRILVDHARKRGRAKRGGGADRVTLEEATLVTPRRPSDLVALDEALEALAEQDERKGRIVELHYFGGLSYEETAEALGISAATVHRDLRMAKAWLYNRLK